MKNNKLLFSSSCSLILGLGPTRMRLCFYPKCKIDIYSDNITIKINKEHLLAWYMFTGYRGWYYKTYKNVPETIKLEFDKITDVKKSFNLVYFKLQYQIKFIHEAYNVPSHIKIGFDRKNKGDYLKIMNILKGKKLVK